MATNFKQNAVTKRFLKIFQQLKEKNKFRSNAAFAKSIDYLPQAFNEVVQGRRDIPLHCLYKFFNVYNIDPAIVFLDDVAENRLAGEYKPYAYERFQVKIHPILTQPDNRERVPLVSKKAAAGYVNGFEDEEFIGQLPNISLPPDLDHKSIVGFQVEGDSMEPNLYDGDWLFCSFLERLDWLRLNRIYVVVSKSGIVVKRVVNYDKEKEVLTLRSDNSQYPDFDMAMNEVMQLWYVEKALTGKFPIPDNITEKIQKLEILINQLKSN